MHYSVTVINGLESHFKRYIRQVNRNSGQDGNSVDFLWFIHREGGDFTLLIPRDAYGRNKAGGAIGAFNHRYGKGSATLN